LSFSKVIKDKNQGKTRTKDKNQEKKNPYSISQLTYSPWINPGVLPNL
jgi:hypothetical protein